LLATGAGVWQRGQSLAVVAGAPACASGVLADGARDAPHLAQNRAPGRLLD